MGSTPVGRPGPAQLVIGVVVALVNAWVLALLSLNLGAASITDGIMLGVVAWLGFMATLTGAQVAFQGRPWNAWLITSVHDVVAEVVMAVIVTGLALRARVRRGTSGTTRSSRPTPWPPAQRRTASRRCRYGTHGSRRDRP